MSFLESLTIKQQNLRKLNVKLVINTFTGNALESYHSHKTIELLNSKNIEIADISDINQELIFDKEKSKMFKFQNSQVT